MKLGKLINRTPFRLVHIGAFIRSLYFWKYCLPLEPGHFDCVLDAGCGPGDYAMVFAAKYPGTKIVAVDIKDTIAYSDPPSNFEFRQESLLDMRESEVYDFIYSVDVLEHIPQNELVLENFYRALKVGGYLYVHIPHGAGDRRIFPSRLFKAHNDWVEVEHVGRQYTLDELRAVLQGIGFTILRAEYTFGIPGELAWELDRLTDRTLVLKVSLMPLLKGLARLAVSLQNSKGNGCLVIAKKLGISGKT